MRTIDKKIGFISLGCDKNRVDLEKMIANIRQAGFDVTSDISQANVVIINSCSFIEPARVETINAILNTSHAGIKALEKIIVTGCINEMHYTDLQEALPEVSKFVRVKDNDNIVNIIYELYNDKAEVTNRYNPLLRSITTPSHYAYLKIADGCDNFCSYCKIPYIRGRYASVKLDDIVQEARALVAMGAKELILVAQDVTNYGVDFKDGTNIVTLIRALSKIEGLNWIRLLYCYPERITEELIQEIKNNPKVCKYLDIPLQHINNDILQSMNRHNSKEKIVALIEHLRSEIPDIALRTTFIVGLPGEDVAKFRELKQFVQDYKLTYVGFFAYSREEGTRAYNFNNQVSEAVKTKRLKEISEIQFANVIEYNKSQIGKVYSVVVDEIIDGVATTRSKYQNPESDNVILVDVDDSVQIGDYLDVKIVDYIDYDFKGERL